MTTWRSSGADAANAALRSSLPFASFYVYAPRGSGALAAGARLLCRRIKVSDPLWLPYYARCVVELAARQQLFARLFSHDAWLVPVPASSLADPVHWAAWHLATALHALGLARGVWPGLLRHSPVRKSATAHLGERPTVYQHLGSLSVCALPALVERVVLVDDVITRGRTLLAAATRLRVTLPHADVRAFALVRTLGFVSQLDRLVAPCQGLVYWAGGDARREP